MHKFQEFNTVEIMKLYFWCCKDAKNVLNNSQYSLNLSLSCLENEISDTISNIFNNNANGLFALLQRNQ